MLEAVSSVLQTAPLSRGPAEQGSNARSFAANPEKIQEIPKAPFVSPFIYVDVNYDKAVLQIRDSETGDVITQFPSENRLRAASAQTQQQNDAAEINSAPQVSSTENVQRSSAPLSTEQVVSSPPPQPSSQNTVTAQQISAFKTAATSGSAGGSGNVSLFA